MFLSKYGLKKKFQKSIKIRLGWQTP